jgi:hypothetical protein
MFESLQGAGEGGESVPEGRGIGHVLVGASDFMSGPYCHDPRRLLRLPSLILQIPHRFAFGMMSHEEVKGFFGVLQAQAPGQGLG